ncbi:MAG TPA: hypothetical protein VKP65_25890 [Rhodothermales bacterium]|nr:hypothetical protein [Rhodothermales bacterium]
MAATAIRTTAATIQAIMVVAMPGRFGSRIATNHAAALSGGAV